MNHKLLKPFALRWVGLVALILLLALPRLCWGFSMGYHYDLIRESMRREGFSRDAYCVALAANSYTDIFQRDALGAVKLIIDDDFCGDSSRLIEVLHFDALKDRQQIDRYWRQLIHNTHRSIVEKANAGDQLGILMTVGITLHIVQDFYAHSNWTELDIPRRAGIKDATYFDLSPAALDRAISGSMVYGRRGLFTHGAGGIEHGALHKDHAGRPYFDSAYRCAYRASLQWLRLIRKWIVDDLRRADLWNSLLSYQYTGNRGHLYTLTSFDEGTIRWLCTYGGAWKTPRRWSETDIIADDMPNVPGIGVTEQLYGLPFLGSEWFANCAAIATGMFEAKSGGGFLIVERVDAARREVRHADVASIPPLDTPVIQQALNFLPGCLPDYDSVQWLRVRIPEAMDLDTGEGVFDVNNEEVGGTSDYWVMFIVNGETEYPYTEAEYVDSSNPLTVWGVMKPLWDRRPVRLEVRMFESDPTDHKDEEMDIRPGAGKALTFEFDPATGSYGAPSGCRVWTIPGGFFIQSDGEGDLRARIYVKVWTMDDFPQVPGYPLLYADRRYDGLCLPVLNDRGNLSVNGFNDRASSFWLPPVGWALDVYEHPDYRGNRLSLAHCRENLHDEGWEDRISSVRVTQRPSGVRYGPVLWTDRNHKGSALQLFTELPDSSACGFYTDLSRFNFNDKASSLEVPDGYIVEVYEHPHLGGQSRQFTSSVLDLHAIGWEDRISSVRVIPPASRAVRSERDERQAILQALRESVKRFPDEDPLRMGFRYLREDVRFPSDIELAFAVTHIAWREDWAWVEVTAENYVAELAALLHKEDNRWQVKGIVNPAYVRCPDETASLDVLAYLYRLFQARVSEVPREIFPSVHPEREAILRVLRKSIPVEQTVLLVKAFKIEGNRATLTVHPRSVDGLNQYEPITAVMRKEGNQWKVETLNTEAEEE
ncbi:MAG: hypothetical protein WHS44_08825 [Fimbriimonadales bacterium]|nr:MAG: hypothetical protein KatS3mg018_1629 [Fimbriimonadales bacterium]